MAMLYSIRENGQGMVEYAFLFLLIALIVIAVLLIFGPTIGNVFSNLNNSLSSY
jgi:Flp pilus assembly pilin Flp